MNEEKITYDLPYFLNWWIKFMWQNLTIHGITAWNLKIKEHLLKMIMGICEKPTDNFIVNIA